MWFYICNFKCNLQLFHYQKIDGNGEISSSPVSSQSQPPMMVSSSGTSGTVMTGSPMSSSNAGVVAAVVIVVLLIITAVVGIIVFMILYFYNKRRNEHYVRTKQFEKMGDSNNSTNEHEELEVTASNTEDHKASNKENINLMPNVYPATCKEKDPTPNDEDSKIGNENRAFGCDNIDDFPPPKPPHQRTQGTSDAIDEEIPPPVPKISKELKDHSNEEIPLKYDSTPTPGNYCYHPHTEQTYIILIIIIFSLYFNDLAKQSVNTNLSIDGNEKTHGECHVPEEDQLKTHS